MDRGEQLFKVFRYTIVIAKEKLLFDKTSKLKIKKSNPNQKAIDKKEGIMGIARAKRYNFKKLLTLEFTNILFLLTIYRQSLLSYRLH